MHIPRRFPFSDQVKEVVVEHSDDYDSQIRMIVSNIIRDEYDAELDEDPDAFGYKTLTLMAVCTKLGKEAERLGPGHIVFQEDLAVEVSIFRKVYKKKTLQGAVLYLFDVEITPEGVSVYNPQLARRYGPGGGEDEDLELTLDI